MVVHMASAAEAYAGKSGSDRGILAIDVVLASRVGCHAHLDLSLKQQHCLLSLLVY